MGSIESFFHSGYCDQIIGSIKYDQIMGSSEVFCTLGSATKLLVLLIAFSTTQSLIATNLL